ncbi:unnamed protein product, partial [Didymodactylos carnosus]
RKDSDTVCLPVTVTAVDIAIKLFVEIIFPQMIVMYDHSADIGGEVNDTRLMNGVKRILFSNYRFFTQSMLTRNDSVLHGWKLDFVKYILGLLVGEKLLEMTDKDKKFFKNPKQNKLVSTYFKNYPCENGIDDFRRKLSKYGIDFEAYKNAYRGMKYLEDCYQPSTAGIEVIDHVQYADVCVDLADFIYQSKEIVKQGEKSTSKDEKRAIGIEKLSEVEMDEENGTSSVAAVAMDGDGCAVVVTGTAETEITTVVIQDSMSKSLVCMGANVEEKDAEQGYKLKILCDVGINTECNETNITFIEGKDDIGGIRSMNMGNDEGNGLAVIAWYCMKVLLIDTSPESDITSDFRARSREINAEMDGWLSSCDTDVDIIRICKHVILLDSIVLTKRFITSQLGISTKKMNEAVKILVGAKILLFGKFLSSRSKYFDAYVKCLPVDLYDRIEQHMFGERIKRFEVTVDEYLGSVRKIDLSSSLSFISDICITLLNTKPYLDLGLTLIRCAGDGVKKYSRSRHILYNLEFSCGCAVWA